MLILVRWILIELSIFIVGAIYFCYCHIRPPFSFGRTLCCIQESSPQHAASLVKSSICYLLPDSWRQNYSQEHLYKFIWKIMPTCLQPSHDDCICLRLLYNHLCVFCIYFPFYIKPQLSNLVFLDYVVPGFEPLQLSVVPRFPDALDL